MFKESALVDTTIFEKKIEAANKVNELYTDIANHAWPTNLPPAHSVDGHHGHVDLSIHVKATDFKCVRDVAALFNNSIDVVKYTGVFDKYRFSPDWNGDLVEQGLQQMVGSDESSFLISDFYISTNMNQMCVIVYTRHGSAKVRWSIEVNRYADNLRPANLHRLTHQVGIDEIWPR
ncbi:hypothetical protein VCHA53O466_140104 [Vibrio chagasii]|nr:hypothetical protein VCHA53O466_140104 [Vibrio chagasii]